MESTRRNDQRLARVALEVLSRGMRPRPAGGNRSYQRFIVLAHQRSGSTWAAATLQAHRNVVCFSEAFNRAEAQLYVPGLPTTSRSLRRLREAAPQTFLDRIVYSGYADEIAAVGFKLMAHHLDQPGSGETLDALLADPSVAIVRITRRNKLAAALSLFNAQTSGTWTVPQSSTTPQSPPVELDPSFCEATMTTFVEEDEQFEKRVADRLHHLVYYEDLVAEPQDGFRQIQEFLAVTPLAIPEPSRQQQPRPLSDAIANFDELAEHFAATRWEEFFNS